MKNKTGPARTTPARRKPDRPGKPGVKPKIVADQKTLDELTKLGGLHCTYADCAAWFGVTEKNFADFLKFAPEAEEAFIAGKGKGRVSMRRRMFEVAMSKTDRGAPNMLIWLSKQHLGMSDRIEATGQDGAPLVPPTLKVEFVKRSDPGAKP